MRIISGKYKSRRIQVPTHLKARPTTDFARESLFNILNNSIDWDTCKALDLFSGTGSIAFEFVSRGCPHVVCVESNMLHYNFICKTRDTLDAKELWALKADVFKYLDSVHEKFDLIFADPPYDLQNLTTLPDIIFKRNLVSQDGVFILEHSKKTNFESHPNFLKEKKYGNVHFSFFENI